MTATQRIRSMLDGSPVKEIGACGWLHTIGADRDTAEVFSSAIIKMTDYSKWDFIKVMPNGVSWPAFPATWWACTIRPWISPWALPSV